MVIIKTQNKIQSFTHYNFCNKPLIKRSEMVGADYNKTPGN